MSETDIVKHEQNYSAEIAGYYSQFDELAESSSRRAHYAQMDPYQAVDWMQQVGGMIRTGNPDSRQYFDGLQSGREVNAATIEPPDQADKEALLREVWLTAQEFLLDPELDDEQALTYAGLTVAGGVLYTHPWIDGNGRGSRTMSYLMIDGVGPSLQSDLSQILEEDGGQRWSSSPGVNLMELYAERYMGRGTAQIAQEYGLSRSDFNNPVPEYDKADYDVVQRTVESDVALDTICLFIQHLDDAGKARLEQYIARDDEGEVQSFDVKAALHDMTGMEQGGIGYAAMLHDASKVARADFVRRFLGVMRIDVAQHTVDPDMTKPAEQIRHPKDRAVHAIYGRLAVDGLILPRDHYRAKFSGVSDIRNKQPGPDSAHRHAA